MSYKATIEPRHTMQLGWPDMLSSGEGMSQPPAWMTPSPPNHNEKVEFGQRSTILNIVTPCSSLFKLLKYMEAFSHHLS